MFVYSPRLLIGQSRIISVCSSHTKRMLLTVNVPRLKTFVPHLLVFKAWWTWIVCQLETDLKWSLTVVQSFDCIMWLLQRLFCSNYLWCLLGDFRQTEPSENKVKTNSSCRLLFLKKTIYRTFTLNLNQAVFTFKDNSCPFQGELDFCLTEQTVICFSVFFSQCNWK